MEEIEKFMTQELASIKPKPATRDLSIMPQMHYSRRIMPYYSLLPQQEEKKVRLIEELCRSFCLSLFFRQQEPVRSLGITSSVAGEGKSFVATMLAHVLANDSPLPVLLVECNWENTSQHDYFGFPPTPGSRNSRAGLYFPSCIRQAAPAKGYRWPGHARASL